MTAYALTHDSLINRIHNELREVVKKFTKSGEIYAGDIQLYKIGDTYYIKFTAEGTSGKAVYDTPLCKEPDIERYKDRYLLEDLKHYCTKILEKLSELVNEEY